MGRRQDLHAILVRLFNGVIGTSDKYVKPCVKYQPGPSTSLTYPAIVYKLDDIQNIYANNRPYLNNHRYEVQVIDRDPESELRNRMINLPLCSFSRSFVSDNLYHFVFEIYY